MVVALAQIDGERLPSRIAKLKINIGLGLEEDVLHDQRIGIAVRHHRANIAVNTEGVENRFVKRKIAVLGPRQRAVDMRKRIFAQSESPWQSSAGGLSDVER